MRTLFVPLLMMRYNSSAETNPWFESFLDSLTFGRGDFSLLLLPFCLLTAGNVATSMDSGLRKLSRSLNLEGKFYEIFAVFEQFNWTDEVKKKIRILRRQ